MGFNKISYIITIILFAYSICGILFLLGVRIFRKIKARKVIKETMNSISHIEVKHNEDKKTIK